MCVGYVLAGATGEVVGFDREGHWVGEEQGAAEMARLRRLERER